MFLENTIHDEHSKGRKIIYEIQTKQKTETGKQATTTIPFTILNPNTHKQQRK